MKYFTTSGKASRRASDCLIVGIYERGKLGIAAEDIDTASGGEIQARIKSGDLSGTPGRCTVLTDLAGVSAKRIVVVGLGKAGALDVRTFRKAVAASARAVLHSKTREILNYLVAEDVAGLGPYYLARYTVQTISDVTYQFTQMKSGPAKTVMPLANIGIGMASRADSAAALRGAEHGGAIVEGMQLAKDLGNLPANVCTPSYLARTATAMTRRYKNLQTKILNEADMKRLGMNSLLSVTAGAKEPAKLIIMQYKGAGSARPIVLVGKGVTFDSGGISLKPGAAMDEMKFDMCGAASVIGTLAVVASLKLKINLTVVVPTVENMPGGGATRPGDIVKSLSGQTIEILNTDAEGRLILCDALTYARRFKPETIIDVATLTGACVIALGHHHSGVMSPDHELAAELVAAGRAADDGGWHLPLGAEYSDQLKSNFADMANIGGRDAGAITAGCFLGNFTDGMHWAHLDIAGTAWHSGQQKGSTGRPVPLLSEFVLSRAGELPG